MLSSHCALFHHTRIEASVEKVYVSTFEVLLWLVLVHQVAILELSHCTVWMAARSTYKTGDRVGWGGGRRGPSTTMGIITLILDFAVRSSSTGIGLYG